MYRSLSAFYTGFSHFSFSIHKKWTFLLPFLLLLPYAAKAQYVGSACLCPQINFVDNGCFEDGNDPCLNNWDLSSGQMPTGFWDNSMGTPDHCYRNYSPCGLEPAGTLDIPINHLSGGVSPGIDTWSGSSTGNDRYAGLLTKADQTTSSTEGIFISLPMQLNPFDDYVVTMKANSWTAAGSAYNGQDELLIYLTNGPPISSGGQTIPDFNAVTNNPNATPGATIANNTWADITYCFNPNGATLDHLVIEGLLQAPTGSTSTHHNAFFIDDVQLVSMADAGDAGTSFTANCSAGGLGPSCAIPGASYSWNNAGLLNNANTAKPTITGTITTPTTFILTTTVGTCTYNDSVTVMPALSGTLTPVQAGANSVGSLTSNITFGITPYTYNWSNSATTANIGPLCAGTYTVTVTDFAGCTTVISATLTGASVPPPVTGIACECDNFNVITNGCFENGQDPCHPANVYNHDLTNAHSLTSWSGIWNNYPAGSSKLTDWTPLLPPPYPLAPVTPDLLVRGYDACNNAHPNTNDIPNNHYTVNVTGGINTWNGTPNDRYVGMANRTWIGYGSPRHEGIQTTLSAPLLPNEDYVVFLKSNFALQQGSYSNLNELMLFLHDAPTGDGLSQSTVSFNMVTNSTTNFTTGAAVSQNTWNDLGYCFTTPAGSTYDQVIIEAKRNTPTASIHSAGHLVDEVKIAKVSDVVEAGPNILGCGTIGPSCAISGATYSWLPIAGLSNPNIANPFANPGAVTTYTMTFTTPGGCSRTDSVTVTPVILSNAVVLDETCLGYMDGSITVNPTNGTPGYTYNWSNGGTANSISGLTAGPYTVTITDANGCILIETNTVNNPNAGGPWPTTTNNASPFDSGRDVVTDAAGNTYVCGDFHGSTELLGTQLNGSPVTFNMFVASFNPCGGLRWVAYSEAGYARASGLALNENTGHVYVTGPYTGMVKWNGTGSTSFTSSIGDFMYLAKYDMANGQLIQLEDHFINHLGFAIHPRAIDINNAGDIFIAGHDLSGTNRGFALVKYDPTNLPSPTWWRNSNLKGAAQTAFDVVVDGSEVYVCGTFGPSIRFDGSTTLSATGQQDAFVAKYLDNGTSSTLAWVTQSNATATSEAYSMALDPSSGLNVVGAFAQQLNGPFGFGAVYSGSSSTGWVARIRTGPGTLHWINLLSPQFSMAEGVAADQNGTYIVGTRDNVIYPYQLPDIHNNSTAQILTAKYSFIGAWQWMQTTSGNGRKRGVSIDMTVNGELISTGTYAGTMSLPSSQSLTSSPSNNDFNAYFARSEPGAGNYYKSGQGWLEPAPLPEVAANGITLYPNPNQGRFTLEFEELAESLTVAVYTPLGQLVWSSGSESFAGKSINIDLDGLPSGMYFVDVFIPNKGHTILKTAIE